MRVPKIMVFSVIFLIIFAGWCFAGNLKMRVVAVNPSETEYKTAKVKTYLPKEVTPGDILDDAGLAVEYDAEKSIYYLSENELELSPRETRVFEVVIRDVWIIPEMELDMTKRRASRILEKLEKSSYYTEAAAVAETIFERLEVIREEQMDETVSREKHIGLYRTNLDVMNEVLKDIERLEKLLTYVGGPPVPEMLEESSIKSDAPTTATTWFVIFLIMGFIGLLGVVFYFTWHKQAQITEKVMLNARKTSFPGYTKEEEPKAKPKVDEDEIIEDKDIIS